MFYALYEKGKSISNTWIGDVPSEGAIEGETMDEVKAKLWKMRQYDIQNIIRNSKAIKLRKDHARSLGGNVLIGFPSFTDTTSYPYSSRYPYTVLWDTNDSLEEKISQLHNFGFVDLPVTSGNNDMLLFIRPECCSYFTIECNTETPDIEFENSEYIINYDASVALILAGVGVVASTRNLFVALDWTRMIHRDDLAIEIATYILKENKKMNDIAKALADRTEKSIEFDDKKLQKLLSEDEYKVAQISALI